MQAEDRLRLANNPFMLQPILLEYLHARECDRIPLYTPCNVPNCNRRKGLLRHISICERVTHPEDEVAAWDCHTIQKCLRHWDTCSASDCPVFSDIKLVEEEWRAQQVEEAADQASYPLTDVAIIEQEIVEMSEAGQLSDLVYDERLVSPMPVPVVKEWHQSVSLELRKRILDKAMQEAFAISEQRSKTEEKLNVSYIRGVEYVKYEISSSREEYYKAAAELIRFFKQINYEWWQTQKHKQLQDRYHQQRDMLMRRLQIYEVAGNNE